VDDLVKEKATSAGSLAELVEELATPRAIWLMVPAAVGDDTIADLLLASRRETSSSTGETLITWTISGGKRTSLTKRSTMWMWAPAEVSGAWSEVIA